MSEFEMAIAIVSMVLGVLSVGLTGWLHKRVSSIENKRREDQKKHFQKLVKNNITEAVSIYKSVTTIAHRLDLNDEEIESKTNQLQRFFSKKHEEIQRLVRDTKFYASMLDLIDSPTINMNEVVKKIAWLTSDFYILDDTVERNKRHWINHEEELKDNRQFIECSLSSLTTLNTS